MDKRTKQVPSIQVPVLDKDGNTITTVDSVEYGTVGAIFIGTGMARRTFVFRGSHSPYKYSFIEVETKTLSDPAAEAAIMAMPESLWRDACASWEEEERGITTVRLPPGHRVRIEIADSDGAFLVSYDHNNDKRLFVRADIPGNVMGNEGIIYLEEFDKDEQPDAKVPSVETPPEIRPYASDGKETSAKMAEEPVDWVAKKLALLLKLRGDRPSRPDEQAMLASLEEWLIVNAKLSDADDAIKLQRLRDLSERESKALLAGETFEPTELRRLQTWRLGVLRSYGKRLGEAERYELQRLEEASAWARFDGLQPLEEAPITQKEPTSDADHDFKAGGFSGKAASLCAHCNKTRGGGRHRR